MPYFCVSVTFLDPQPSFHGRGDAGKPEWPPSPLRVFQALVAAAAAHWRESQFWEYAKPALGWLEQQPAPTILAPSGHVGIPVRLAVPNNDLDVVATAWSRGQEPKKQPSELKTMKTVRQTHLRGGNAVHYLFPLTNGCPHLDVLAAAARSITHLGWGVDMVVADATVISEDDTTKLLGERWRPLGGISAGGLRVPTEGTLSDLANKHTAFLHRLSDEGFTAVPPLSAYQVVGYRRDADPPTRPFAAFQLLTPDAEGFRVFDPRRAIVVARMVRSATALAAGAAGRSKAWIRTTVLGHGGGPQGQAQIGPDDDRFAYLPLPTIEPRRQNGGRQRVVGSIRRILIAERPGGSGEQVAWARRMLSGYELVNQQTNTSEAVLSLIPSQDSVVRHYVESATTWSTVTPVILPGYDGSDPEKIRRRVSGAKTDEERQQRLDKVTAKTDRLLRKAIEQAGLPPTLAEHAELEWRPVGFLPGVDLASRYALPPYLKSSPRYHVRIRWRDASGQPVSVRGPLVIGAGRYRGLGLFVADEPRRGFV